MDHFSSRRRFVQGALALASGTVVASVARPARGDDMTPIIDTHQHLWDRSQFTLPWIEPGSVLDRDYRPNDYREATRGLGVVKAVYMEVDVAPEQQVAEANHILDLIRRGQTPTVAAVISGRPASDGFAAYLDRFRDAAPIKGLRQVLHGASTSPGYCLDPAFVRGIRLLGERGLSFDLCMRPADLPDAAKLIDACPDTRFVLDHCGNADVRSADRSRWRADVAAIADRKNVAACKVSGIVATVKGAPWTADDLAPIVNHVLDTFGPDRVIFGGDWPVCTLGATFAEWLGALKSIVANRSEADRRKLFHDNAVDVYRLT